MGRATQAEVIATVARLGEASPGRTVWIGIDGFGGAGKSFLADRVARPLPRADVIHIDDFSRPSNREWEWDRFRTQVQRPLQTGRPARYQVWNWVTDTGGDWIETPPGRILVIEGVSCTRSEVEVDWDLTVWVDTPAGVRRSRAIDRDGESMWPQWRDIWIPAEQEWAAREQPHERADLVVPGTPDDLGQSRPS